MFGPRKFLAVASCVAAILAALSVPARADLREVRMAKKLRVLATDGAPAFFGGKPGKPLGLEGEILQGFCKLQDLSMVAVTVPSASALLHALAKGDGDIAAGGLLVTDGSDIQFSSEILPSRYVVVTRKPSPPILKLEELKEMKVGSVRGVTLAELAGLPADDAQNAAGLIIALRSGKVTAAILGMEYAIPARAEDPELQIGAYVGAKLSLALAVRRDEPQLREALNEYIANLRRTATWNRLVLKYFGDGAIEILKAAR